MASTSNKPDTARRVLLEVGILCRLWEEDGVWNGSAVDLPVAVFGHSFEDARQHLVEALIAHLEALDGIGKLESTVGELRKRAKDLRLAGEQMPNNQPIVNIVVGVVDHHVYALV